MERALLQPLLSLLKQYLAKLKHKVIAIKHCEWSSSHLVQSER